jgi:glycosyltransferase involved in cell wall biosynthesis
MNVSVVMPVYNEQQSIADVIAKTKEVLSSHKLTYEIIAVNDASKDETGKVLEKISGIKVITHLHNKGYGAAIKTGINNALYDTVVTMDSDGQHYPEDILRLLEHTAQYPIVVGYRTQRMTRPIWRLPGKWFLGWLASHLTGKKIPDLNSGLRAFKKEVISKYLHLLCDEFSFSTTSTLLFFIEGYDIKYVPIKVKKRTGKSTLSFKVGFHTFMLILRFVMIFEPLRILLPASFFIGGIGTIYLIHDIFQRNVTDMALLLVLMGVLLFFFGLLADQIAHIRKELK